MKAENSNVGKFAIPAAAMTILAPVAAFAAEGTGRVSLVANSIICWN